MGEEEEEVAYVVGCLVVAEALEDLFPKVVESPKNLWTVVAVEVLGIIGPSMTVPETVEMEARLEASHFVEVVVVERWVAFLPSNKNGKCKVLC